MQTDVGHFPVWYLLGFSDFLINFLNYFWGIFHFFFTSRFWCWYNFMECDTFEVFLAQKHLIFFLQIISLYKTGLKVFQGPILQRFLSQVLGILTSNCILAHAFSWSKNDKKPSKIQLIQRSPSQFIIMQLLIVLYFSFIKVQT